MPSQSVSIKAGARKSPLSQAQCREVLREICFFTAVDFVWILTDTIGDLDRTTSLWSLDKSDFFTREIDDLVLRGVCRVGIHSAKDLSDPLRTGLEMMALTQGVDSSDVVVIGKTFHPNGSIASSSQRRERAVRNVWPGCRCVDIRGTIEERISLVHKGDIDGVVIAKAALIRLEMLDQVEWIPLEGETTPLQGKLAVVGRCGDEEIRELFRPIDIRTHANI